VALNDAHHLAVVAVTLRQSHLATQPQIATAFGHSVATQRRWETRYLQYGSEGLRHKTPTGRKPKIDGSQRAFVRRWFEAGVTNREMARRLAVSETTIRRVLRQLGLHRSPTPAAELPFTAAATLIAPAVPSVPAAIVETTAALSVDEGATPITSHASPTPSAAAVASLPEVDVPPPETVAGNTHASTHGLTIDSDPADRSGDRFLARKGLLDDAVPLFGDVAELPRAGVLLVIPLLQAHGGPEVFQRLYGSIGPAFYGLRTTVLSLVLLALLRIKQPENVKEYSPERLGQIS
jgi:transposase